MEITLVRVKKCKMFCFALFQQFEEARLYNILFQNGKNLCFFNKEFGIISVNYFGFDFLYTFKLTKLSKCSYQTLLKLYFFF